MASLTITNEHESDKNLQDRAMEGIDFANVRKYIVTTFVPVVQ
jgi:hypothetical protein